MIPVRSLQNYLNKPFQVVLDVYIEKSQARVWVMDFNPWGSKTDSLLFEWDELKNMNTNAEIVYKVIEKAQEIQESGLSQYKVPIVNH